MANHIHLVVETQDDAEPTKILADFKAYGSRALTARFGKAYKMVSTSPGWVRPVPNSFAFWPR